MSLLACLALVFVHCPQPLWSANPRLHGECSCRCLEVPLASWPGPAGQKWKATPTKAVGGLEL